MKTGSSGGQGSGKLARSADKGAGILLSEGSDPLPAQSSLIERLSPADRERVRQFGRPRDFARGETLFAQGDLHDGIMIIESGLVRSFYTAPSGREITLAYWLPGNFVGGPELFGGGQHIWTAMAVRRSVVTILPGQGLRDLVRSVPDLALAFIDALVFKGKCYSSLAQMLGTRSLGERLRQLLLHMVRTYGVEDEKGILIAAHFTHAEMANLIGGTRQWVTISLNRLEKQGLISHRLGSLVVHDIDSLIRPEPDTDAG